jgi:hypothetical protein
MEFSNSISPGPRSSAMEMSSQPISPGRSDQECTLALDRTHSLLSTVIKMPVQSNIHFPTARHVPVSTYVTTRLLESQSLSPRTRTTSSWLDLGMSTPKTYSTKCGRDAEQPHATQHLLTLVKAAPSSLRVMVEFPGLLPMACRVPFAISLVPRVQLPIIGPRPLRCARNGLGNPLVQFASMRRKKPHIIRALPKQSRL